MAGPGGDEVGRVSIRVVPDTDGFRRELQRAVESAEAGLEVTIPVDFDVDTAGLRAQLEALELSQITIPVVPDLDTAALRAQIAALDNSRITIPVDLDLRDEARINAVLQRLSNRTININVRLHGVNQAIARLTALDAIVRRLDGRQINIHVDVDAAGAIAQIAAIEAALLALRGSIGSIGSSGGRAFGGMRQGAMLAAGALVLLPPLAAAVAVAGAAVTAAWGAAATSIAVIPAALFTVAGPLAAIALGLDGIKKAASVLKPEFESLKSYISTTFENQLTPVFQRLVAVFPALRDGLHGTAHALVGVTSGLVDLVATEAGVTRLRSVFANLNEALVDMTPGIVAAVDGLIMMGSQSGAFQVLTAAVNTFGNEFRASVIDLIAGGTLESAMTGLRGTLEQLTLGFVQLVDNGIRLFASAAPGLNAALASITGFFERFDWGSLGSSVGGVFQGIADGINSIPQGTISAIEREFAELSAVFQSGEMQAGIRAIADAIPGAISLIGDLSKEFGSIAEVVGPMVSALATASDAFSTFLEDAYTAADQFGKQMGLQGPGSIGEWLNGLNTSLNEALGIIPPKAEDLGVQTGEAGARGLRGGGGTFGKAAEEEGAMVPPALEQGMSGTEAAVTNAMTPATAALVTALGQMPPLVQQAFAGLAAPVAAGMATMSAAVDTGMIGVRTTMATGFATMGVEAANGLMQVEMAINSATLNWNTRVQAAMTLVQTTMSTGWTTIAAAASLGLMGVEMAINSATLNWNTRVQAAMTLIQTTMTTGWTTIGASASLGLMAVEMAINSATLNWNTRVQAAMTLIQTTMSTGFVQLGAAASLGLMQVEMAINSAVLAWVTRVQAGMTLLQATMTTGWTMLAASASLGLMQVEVAINSAILAWSTRITAGMVLMQATMATGWTTIAAAASLGLMAVEMAINSAILAWNTQLLSGMTIMQATVAAGMAALAAAVTAGMAQVQSAFVVNWAAVTAATTAAMAQISAAVVAGMAQVVQATTAGWQQMVAAAQTGTQQMVAAVQAGSQQMVAALQAAISRCVGILNAAVGQFRAAGANMGAALAAGLESQVGRVQAAANRLAQAAAAATRAAAGIRSPSRVFIEFGELMAEGLAIGLRTGASEAVREADRMTRAVIASVSDLPDALAVDDWASDLNARMNASLSTNDVPDGGAAKQVVIQTTVNNPLPERGSDSIAHVHRRHAEMGMFG